MYIANSFVFAFLASLAVLSFAADVCDARKSYKNSHKKRSSKRFSDSLQYHKCANEDSVVIGLVANPLDKKTIQLAMRYKANGHKNLVIFIDGKDVHKPTKMKHKLRNVSFIQKNKDDFTWGVLPYKQGQKFLDTGKTRTLSTAFGLSASYIGKILGVQPKIAYISNNIESQIQKKHLRHLVEDAGFTLINGVKTSRDIDDDYVSRKSTFMYIQEAADVTKMSQALDIIIGSMLTISHIKDCVRKAPYIRIPVKKTALKDDKKDQDSDDSDEDEDEDEDEE